MAGHTNYAHAAGGYTGQPAYSVTSTEFSLTHEWEDLWMRETPLLAMIHSGKANWNKKSLKRGNAMLIPVIYADASTTADGVTDANELTPITPYAISGMSQAFYNIAHYRHALYHRASEQQLNNNDRANLLDGAVRQLMNSFKDEIAGDLMGTAADARDAVLGIQQVLATANTVGGIDQSSNSDWQSNVTISAGAFTLDLIDDKVDVVAPRRGNTDLILLGFTSSLNLFGKLRAALAPSQRLVNTQFEAKYGFKNIEYLGATCISENRLSSGVIVGLDSRTWYHCGDTRPQLHHNDPLPGTDADEHLYNMFLGIGCSNPARNWRLTGVS